MTYQRLLADDLDVVITDLQGKKLLSMPLNSGFDQRERLYIEDLPAGIYMLQVVQNTEVVLVERLVIQHN